MRKGTLGAQSKIGVVLLVLIALGCAQGQKRMPDPGKRYELDGISVLSPAGAAWKVEDYSRHQVLFGWPSENIRQATLIATAHSIPIDHVPVEQRLLLLRDHSEKLKNDASTGWFHLVSFNAAEEKFSGADCERYDLTAEDRGVPQASGQILIMTVRGLACMHPSKQLFVKVEYSKRILKQEELPRTGPEGDDFLNSLQFGLSVGEEAM